MVCGFTFDFETFFENLPNLRETSEHHFSKVRSRKLIPSSRCRQKALSSLEWEIIQNSHYLHTIVV